MKFDTHQLINKALSGGLGTSEKNSDPEIDQPAPEADDSQGSIDPGTHMVVLEDRILYDAAPFDAGMASDVPVQDINIGLELAEQVDWAEVVGGIGASESGDGFQADVESLDLLDQAELLIDQELGTGLQSVTDLVVIDASVDDFQQIIDDLASSATVEVLVITEGQNGLSNVAERLSVGNSFSALHIVSHSDSTGLTLGVDRLTLDLLDHFSDTLSSWQDGLTESADILLYGCNLAETSDGQLLMSYIVDLTEADIAASSDLTGHQSLGGDWVLEFQSGEIQSEVIVSNEFQANWENILPVADLVVPTDATDLSTSRENRGSSSAVAMDDNGNYVVVWSEQDSTDGWQVVGQRFDYLGVPTGDKIEINQHLHEDQYWASVAMDANGNFVVTWTDQSHGDSEVFGRFFGVDGFDSGEFLVGVGEDSSVTMNDQGQYAFAWETSGTTNLSVRASFYDSDHTLIRGDFLVDNGSGNNRDADLSLNNNGELAIAWETSDAVWTRRINADGSDGNIAQVDFGAFNPTIALRDDGIAIVVGTVFGDGTGLVANVLNDNLNSLDEFVVNDTRNNNQEDASIVLLGDSDFRIVWAGIGQQAGQEDSDGGIFGKTFSYEADTDTLETLHSEFRFNDHVAGAQKDASIAAVDNEHFVVVWNGPTNSSTNAIVVQQFGFVNQAPEIIDPFAYATEGIDFVFTEANLGYGDVDSDPFDTLRVIGAPTNGELLLNGTVVSDGDEISALAIANGELIYRQTSPGYGSDFDSFEFNVSDGERYAESSEHLSIDLFPRNVLWASTTGNVSGASSVPGLNNWLEGDTLQFGGSDLDLTNPTLGHFSQQFSLSDFGGQELDSLHYVTESVVVGNGLQTVLNVGDIVFSTGHTESLPGVAQPIQDTDLVVFRPTSGDYSTGTFTVLFDSSSMATDGIISGFSDIDGFTILEKDTVFGDTILEAGNIIISDEGSNQMFLLDLVNTGLDNSSGTTRLLIDGADLNIQNAITGIDIIERDSEIGGRMLEAGSLLLSVDGSEDVGDNNQPIDGFDIAVFDIDNTSLNGTASGSAEKLFDGNDVGFQTSSEYRLDGISALAFLHDPNVAPEVVDQTFSIFENSPDGSAVGTIVASDANNGDVLRFQVVGGTGAATFAVDELTGEITVTDSANLDYESVVQMTLQLTVTDAQGLVETATVTIDVSDQPEHTISGQLFNDRNANGNISDDPDGVGQTVFEGATVHLYHDTNGNSQLDAGDSLVRTAQSDSDGVFTFDQLYDDSYFVVVDSRTLEPAQGYNGANGVGDVWAEQTWGASGSLASDGSGGTLATTADGVLFGGRTATGSDDVGNVGTIEHAILVDIGSEGNRNDLDFGFSFNVVTNVEGGSDASVAGQTFQGSFRQFIVNANSIAGDNEMRFVPVVGANQADRGTWRIDISEALPEVIDAGTIIDGQAWSHLDGVSQIDGNPDVIGDTGVTVGVNDHALASIDRPELELFNDGVVAYGLLVSGEDVEISGLRIDGFGDGNQTGNLIIRDAHDISVHDNHILNATQTNIVVGFGSDRGNISRNVIQNGANFGALFNGSNGDIQGWLLSENQIVGNSWAIPHGDGIDLQFATSVTVERNYIAGHQGSGIDMYRNSGEVTMRENSIVNNGFGGQETSGIRVMGSNHLIQENVITGSEGAGVLVVGDGAVSGSGNEFIEISQNEFGNNGGISIDLAESGDSGAELNRGDGVSNFNTPNTAAGNQGLASPNVASVQFDSGNTTISGAAGPNQRIEIYQAIPDADGLDESGGNSYGEGVKYLGWTMTDSMGQFNFLTSGLGPDDMVAAIAIDATSNTSEFSANTAVNVAPDGASFAISLASGSSHIFSVADFDYNDADGDSFAGVQVVTSATNGQLLLNGTLVPDGTFVDILDVQNGMLEYVAPVNIAGAGVDSIQFSVSDGLANSAVQDIVVNVSNDTPVVTTGDNVNIDENEASFGVAGFDPDGDVITYSLGSGNDESLFSIDPGTGDVTFNTIPDFENPHDSDLNNQYEVEVIVTDTAGNAGSKLITVHVENVNDVAPVFSMPTSYEFAENSNVAVSLTATDVDSSAPATFSIDPVFSDGTLFTVNSSGILSMTSNPDFEIPADSNGDNIYQVRVGASDGVHTTFVNLEIKINPVNDNLHVITTDANHSIAEGGAFGITMQASDADTPSDSLTWSIVQGTSDFALFNIDQFSGAITLDVATDFENPVDRNTNNIYTVIVAAADGDGNTVTKRIRVSVTDVNEAINGAVVPDNVDENSAAGTSLGNVVVDNPDADDVFTFQLLDDGDGNFEIDAVTGELRVAAGADLNHEVMDSHMIHVLVSDGNGHSWNDTVRVLVNNINEPPVAIDVSYNGVQEGGQLEIQLSDFDSIIDPDGDVLVESIVHRGHHGTAMIQGTSIVYTHHGSENFEDIIVYRVSDGNGGMDQGNIRVSINPVNDAPQATGEQFVQNTEGALTISKASLLANDIDPDSGSLSVVVIDGPTTGVLSTQPNGDLVYLPDFDTPSVETIRYLVTDGISNSNIVVAELVVPFPVPVILEPEIGVEVEAEEEIDTNENELPDAIGVANNIDDDDDDDNNNASKDLAGARFEANRLDGKANDLESGQNSVNSKLADNSLLSTNYGFGYQKSSIDLSQLFLDSSHASQARLGLSEDPYSSRFLGSIWAGLDQVNEDIMENVNSATGNIMAAAGLTGLATAVYVLYMARGGMLVASVVSSMPAWQSFDPLPILQYSAEQDEAGAEDDSIESLLDRE